jgi:hypothetical protein
MRHTRTRICPRLGDGGLEKPALGLKLGINLGDCLVHSANSGCNF